MNEGTPLGSEYNTPMAVVLKGPTAELYFYLLHVQGFWVFPMQKEAKE
jgi:hypothetical protein